MILSIASTYVIACDLYINNSKSIKSHCIELDFKSLFKPTVFSFSFFRVITLPFLEIWGNDTSLQAKRKKKKKKYSPPLRIKENNTSVHRVNINDGIF